MRSGSRTHAPVALGEPGLGASSNGAPEPARPLETAPRAVAGPDRSRHPREAGADHGAVVPASAAPVDEPPSFAPLADLSMLEDAAPVTVQIGAFRADALRPGQAPIRALDVTVDANLLWVVVGCLPASARPAAES